MEQAYIIDGLCAKFEKNDVLSAMDCPKDSPVYTDMCDIFNSIHDKMLSLIRPVGILGFGEITQLTATEKYPSGTKIIYAVTSIGDEIHQYSTNSFNSGNYVIGLMSNIMADCALFSLEDTKLKKLKEICTANNIGISARLEAPHDISMHILKEAWERLDLSGRLGISITSGYMFDPVKTSCQVFVVSEDTSEFNACHDCRNCPNTDCKFRSISCIK